MYHNDDFIILFQLLMDSISGLNDVVRHFHLSVASEFYKGTIVMEITLIQSISRFRNFYNLPVFLGIK